MLRCRLGLPVHGFGHYDPPSFGPLCSWLRLIVDVYAALFYLLVAPLIASATTTPVAPDTLVICPAEFRSALTPWEQLRQQQGHQILIVPPPVTAAEVDATICRVGESGQLKYLLLIGDVPHGTTQPNTRNPITIATNYLPAKINTRWGSEPTIATDTPYADLDGDQSPDLAVGRIPADSAEELAGVVRKIMRYEQHSQQPESQPRLNLVAGVGGFGSFTDALVEAAARQVFLQTVPPGVTLQHTSANPDSPNCPPPGEFRDCVRRQFGEQSLAWIYMGHGLPTELDRVRRPAGSESILSVADVPKLRCPARSPLAVFVACYTGAFDAPADSLAEELLLAEQGPIAVVAATRVTMPYGNTVLGYELLRACFKDHPSELGNIVRMAQRRTLDQSADNPLRASLDGLAHGLSPPPIDLAAERREHVLMYHLLGDPLTLFHRPAPMVAQSSDGTPLR
jgi:hypothetical protein